MYEFIYKVPSDMEEGLTGLLVENDISSFYFELCRGESLLNIFLDTDEPLKFIDESLLQSVKEVDQKSWSRAWGENYTGHELTNEIFVLPSGVDPPAKRYKTVIEVDPFDSFGDGHHPTTRLCGQLLEHVISDFTANSGKAGISMLDVGTGSGILSIAAWTMGVRDIDLFDYEPVAVEKAEKNLKLNHVEGPVPHVADIYSYRTEKKYDVVTANLLSRIIEDNIGLLVSLLKPGGKLILSGINTLWTDGMKKLFAGKNLEIKEHKIIDEWNGFVLIRAHSKTL